MAIWTMLEDALARASGANNNIDVMVAEPLLSPWALTLLVALARHKKRQEWVAEVARTRLGANLTAIARAGAAGHPEHIEQAGDVPGLPEWKYFFHGCGLCLTHRESGESIDVDFVENGRADAIDAFFFANYVESLPRSEPVEADLIRLHPSFATIKVSMIELVEHGLITKGWRAQQSDDTRQHEHLLFALAERWSSSKPLTDAAIDRRRAWLKDHDTDGYTLEAYAETKPPDLKAYLETALEAPALTSRTSTALDLITRFEDRAYCAPVWKLFRRIDPKGAIPQPHLWSRCATFLLRYEREVDSVLATFSDVGGTEVGEAALLALEHARSLGRPLLRKALRSDVPHARGVAAATLALLVSVDSPDEPWALTELEVLLRESTDEEATAECRAALRACGDPNQSGDRWEAAHLQKHAPHGKMMTITDLMLRGTAERVAFEMDRLRERVARIFGRQPN